MKLMGHRGARDKAPENTLPSFQYTLDLGLPSVEFDIHECADGTWVVHHDDTLDRTTTSSGFIRQKTWDYLKTVKTKEGDSLPRLEQVLALFKNSTTELQIELKSPGNLKELGRILNDYFNTAQITIISFNHRWLLQFKNENPSIKTTCLLFGLPTNPVQVVQSAKANGLSLSVNWIDAALVKECHDAGLKVTAWNANDLPTFKRLKEMNVDYLGTDVPFAAVHWD